MKVQFIDKIQRSTVLCKEFSLNQDIAFSENDLDYLSFYRLCDKITGIHRSRQWQPF